MGAYNFRSSSVSISTKNLRRNATVILYFKSTTAIIKISKIALVGRKRMNLLTYHPLSIDSTTGLAILVVSLLVIVLIVMRTYHKRIASKEKIVAQKSEAKKKKEMPTLKN